MATLNQIKIPPPVPRNLAQEAGVGAGTQQLSRQSSQSQLILSRMGSSLGGYTNSSMVGPPLLPGAAGSSGSNAIDLDGNASSNGGTGDRRWRGDRAPDLNYLPLALRASIRTTGVNPILGSIKGSNISSGGGGSGPVWYSADLHDKMWLQTLLSGMPYTPQSSPLGRPVVSGTSNGEGASGVGIGDRLLGPMAGNPWVTLHMFERVMTELEVTVFNKHLLQQCGTPSASGSSPAAVSSTVHGQSKAAGVGGSAVVTVSEQVKQQWLLQCGDLIGPTPSNTSTPTTSGESSLASLEAATAQNKDLNAFVRQVQVYWVEKTKGIQVVFPEKSVVTGSQLILEMNRQQTEDAKVPINETLPLPFSLRSDRHQWAMEGSRGGGVSQEEVRLQQLQEANGANDESSVPRAVFGGGNAVLQATTSSKKAVTKPSPVLSTRPSLATATTLSPEASATVMQFLEHKQRGLHLLLKRERLRQRQDELALAEMATMRQEAWRQLGNADTEQSVPPLGTSFSKPTAELFPFEEVGCMAFKAQNIGK